MRAIRLHERGGPEVLRIEETPTPTPGPGEVVVKLQTAAINRRDVWIRLGRQFPDLDGLIPGSDGAGVVAAVGEGVSGWREGDEVLINPTLCDRTCAFCQAGEQSECDNFGILGGPLDGTYAEYVRLPAY